MPSRHRGEKHRRAIAQSTRSSAGFTSNDGTIATGFLFRVNRLLPDYCPIILKTTSPMAKQLQSGDRVRWNTPQGKTTGVIQAQLTSETHISGQKVAASEDDPRYVVKSEKSGKAAAHKPDSLEKLD